MGLTFTTFESGKGLMLVAWEDCEVAYRVSVSEVDGEVYAHDLEGKGQASTLLKLCRTAVQKARLLYGKDIVLTVRLDDPRKAAKLDRLYRRLGAAPTLLKYTIPKQ